MTRGVAVRLGLWCALTAGAGAAAACDGDLREAAPQAVAGHSAALVRCPFCGFYNEDGALFCEQCKSDLSAVPQAPAPLILELPAIPTPIPVPEVPSPVPPRADLPPPSDPPAPDPAADPVVDPPAPDPDAPDPGPPDPDAVDPIAPVVTCEAPDADHIKCPFCGFVNEAGALFCEQCKSDLSAVCPPPALPPPPIPLPRDPGPLPPPAPCPTHATEHIKCPFCGFDNEPGALFCEQCKSDISAVCPAPAPDAAPPPPTPTPVPR